MSQRASRQRTTDLNKLGFTMEGGIVKSCVSNGIYQVDSPHSAQMQKEVHHVPVTSARCENKIREASYCSAASISGVLWSILVTLLILTLLTTNHFNNATKPHYETAYCK